MMGLTKEGDVYAWGKNEDGKLGLGDLSMRDTPTHVSGISDVAEIVCAGHHSLALKKNKELWGWGWNDRGNIGIGRGADQMEREDHGGSGGRGLWAHNLARTEVCGPPSSFLLPSSFFLFPPWPFLLPPSLFILLIPPLCFSLIFILGWHHLRLGIQLGCPTRDPNRCKHLPAHAQRVLAGKNIKCFGAGYEFSWAIEEDGTLFIWGYGYSSFLERVPGIKFFVPWPMIELWKPVFRWFFLGKSSLHSFFSELPIEVLFNTVSVFSNK
jgi:hypothetical protein